jgi:hypothetical protein
MKTDTPQTAGAEIVLAGGIVTVPTDILRDMAAQDANARGIVLANDRIKVNVLHTVNGVEVAKTYTLSFYVQRDPLDETEADTITKLATERDANKAKREADDQAKREREIGRAQELGQQSILSAMKNLDALASGARVLGALTK